MKKKLKDICKITSGQSAPQNLSDYIENGKTFIKVSNLDDIIADDNENRACKISDEAIEKGKLKLFPANTVIFAKSGLSCVKNRVYVTKEPAYLFNHFCCLYDFDENIMTKWFAYFLRAYNVTNLIKDYAYPSIPIKEIGQIYVSITPLAEQQKIAAELDTIQSAIDNKKQQLALLDEAVKSEFVEMFGENPTENGKWKVEKWENIFNTTTGKLDSNAMVENGQYPFFTCAKEIFAIDHYAFDQEALLLAGNNAAGKYDVKYYKGKFNAYQRTYVLSLKEDWSYRLFQFQLEDKLLYLKEQSKGINTKFLTLKILQELEFIIPPKELQLKFETFVQKIDKSKSLVKQQIADLQELLDSKMQKYFG